MNTSYNLTYPSRLRIRSSLLLCLRFDLLEIPPKENLYSNWLEWLETCFTGWIPLWNWIVREALVSAWSLLVLNQNWGCFPRWIRLNRPSMMILLRFLSSNPPTLPTSESYFSTKKKNFFCRCCKKSFFFLLKNKIR